MTYHDHGSTTRPSYWRRLRSSAGDPQTTLLFWLAVFLLACVSTLSVAWGASSVLAQKGSEKLLRVERLFPKLNSTQGERKADAFRMSEREPSELPHPKERKATAAPPVLPAVIDPPRSTSEPVPLANVIVPMDAPAETCHDPLIHLVRCTSQLGDSPMIRNWKTLTMVALLSQAAVTFVPQPAVAQETDRKTPPNELKALDDLQKSVNALIERIDKLEKKKSLSADDLADVVRTEIRAELKKAHEAIYKNFDGIAAELTAIRQIQLAHKREIDKLSDDLNGLRKKLADGAGTPAVDKAFMEEFRSSLKTLNDTIARLGPTKERISGAAPINGSAKGRLVIVNLYNEDLLFLVNGAPHRVPAGMSAVLEVPAGTLNYRVHSNRWGPLSHQTTNLAAGDTYTLTAAFQR